SADHRLRDAGKQGSRLALSLTRPRSPPSPAGRGWAKLARLSEMRLRHRVLPFAGIALLLAAWDIAIRVSRTPLLPGPLAVAKAIAELAQKGFLVKHVVASLFRVTWGYLLAVAVGVPFGILIAWYRRGGLALAPLVEIVRPVS